MSAIPLSAAYATRILPDAMYDVRICRLWTAIGINIILLIALAVALVVIARQLRHRRQQQRKLEALTEQLIETNRRREHYVSLFLELCASYIDKYNRYRTEVIRKVKVHQADDLLKAAGRTRPAEQESREFFFNFDSAFLRIYPDFISQFNSLLRPDQRIAPAPGELLNTDLRIFALIRMGITDSAKIAALLFYSPQTIYNYRTAVRARAIDRDTFEQSVAKLCLVHDISNHFSANPEGRQATAMTTI